MSPLWSRIVFLNEHIGRWRPAGSRSCIKDGEAANHHPPTAAMSQATQGHATSSEDVRRQNAGQPTAAQQGTTGTAAQHPPTAVMSEATQGQAAPATVLTLALQALPHPSRLWPTQSVKGPERFPIADRSPWAAFRFVITRGAPALYPEGWLSQIQHADHRE